MVAKCQWIYIKRMSTRLFFWKAYCAGTKRGLHKLWSCERCWKKLYKTYISDKHVSDGMWRQITPEEMPEDWDFSTCISEWFKSTSLQKLADVSILYMRDSHKSGHKPATRGANCMQCLMLYLFFFCWIEVVDGIDPLAAQKMQMLEKSSWHMGSCLSVDTTDKRHFCSLLQEVQMFDDDVQEPQNLTWIHPSISPPNPVCTLSGSQGCWSLSCWAKAVYTPDSLPVCHRAFF